MVCGTGTAHLLCPYTVNKCSHSHIFNSLYENPACLIERAYNNNGFIRCSGVQDTKILIYIDAVETQKGTVGIQVCSGATPFPTTENFSIFSFQRYYKYWCVNVTFP